MGKSPRAQEADVDYESIEITVFGSRWSVVNGYHIPHDDAYRAVSEDPSMDDRSVRTFQNAAGAFVITVSENPSMDDRSICTFRNAAGAFVIVSIASAWMILRKNPILEEFIKILREVGLPAAKILCLTCNGPIAVPLQIVPLTFLTKIFL